MRIFLLAILIVSGLFSGSCKKISELTQFDLKYNTETTIEAGVATLLPFDVNTPDIQSQTEDEFQGHKTAKNLIQSITLKELKISITAPEEQNFDFLKNLEIYISSDGMEELKLAWKTEIPENIGKEIVLDNSDADIKPYLLSEKFRLRLKTTTDKVLNNDVQIKIANIFRVDANILGL